MRRFESLGPYVLGVLLTVGSLACAAGDGPEGVPRGEAELPDTSPAEEVEDPDVGDPDVTLADIAPPASCGLGELDSAARCDLSWRGLGTLVALVPEPNEGLYLVFAGASGSGTVVYLNAVGAEVGRTPVETSGAWWSAAACADGGVCLVVGGEPVSLVRVAATPMSAPVVAPPVVGAASPTTKQRLVWVTGATKPSVLWWNPSEAQPTVSLCAFGEGAACTAHTLPVACPDGTVATLYEAVAWSGVTLVAGTCSTQCDLFCDRFDAFVVPLDAPSQGWRPLGALPYGSGPRLVLAPGWGDLTASLWLDVEIAPGGYSDDGGSGSTAVEVGALTPEGDYTVVWRSPSLAGWGVPHGGVAVPGLQGVLYAGPSQSPAGSLDVLSLAGASGLGAAHLRRFDWGGLHTGRLLGASVGGRVVLGVETAVGPALIGLDGGGSPLGW